jgi:hypothetical protein
MLSRSWRAMAGLIGVEIGTDDAACVEFVLTRPVIVIPDYGWRVKSGLITTVVSSPSRWMAYYNPAAIIVGFAMSTYVK